MTIMETRPVTSPGTMNSAQIEAVAYFEFLYGWGVAPGVDLGAMGSYGKIPTDSGSVYRQNYARGIGLGNLGDDAAVVVLERPYLDMTGKVVTSVTIPGHSIKILVNDR
jgi:hypothetical protein